MKETAWPRPGTRKQSRLSRNFVLFQQTGSLACALVRPCYLPVMPSALWQFFQEKISGEKPLDSTSRKATKYWIKIQLLRIFPELRDDPDALEELYRELDLEARKGAGKGGSDIFEIKLPQKYLDLLLARDL